MQSKAFINNAWTNSYSGNTFQVTNPANGHIITEVADCGEAETIQAIDAASKAFAGWSRKTAKDRSEVMKKWFKLITNNADDIAMIMTTEQGKPLSEAKAEVAYGASFIEWFAEEGRRVYGDVIPTPVSSKRMFTIKTTCWRGSCYYSVEFSCFHDYKKDISRTCCRLHCCS